MIFVPPTTTTLRHGHNIIDFLGSRDVCLPVWGGGGQGRSGAAMRCSRRSWNFSGRDEMDGVAIDNGLPVGVLYGFVQYNSGISFLSSTVTDLGSILSVD